MSKMEHGEFWHMSGEELYEDYKRTREVDSTLDIGDYFKEFEHQFGNLNPVSMSRCIVLLTLEILRSIAAGDGEVNVQEAVEQAIELLEEL